MKKAATVRREGKKSETYAKTNNTARKRQVEALDEEDL
jgi:hypothetical protein